MKVKMIALSAFCGVALVISISQPLQAQQKFVVEKGKINFISNAPLEVIKASSDKIKGAIDPATNQFAFVVSISTFEGFNGSLQREHFNEKYLESDKYQTAYFSGKIIEQVDFNTDGVYEVRAKGDLNIHGQKQIRIIKTKLTIKDGVMTIQADFNVPLADHKITIPTIINEKIATEIEVSINATLKQQLSARAN